MLTRIEKDYAKVSNLVQDLEAKINIDLDELKYEFESSEPASPKRAIYILEFYLTMIEDWKNTRGLDDQ